MFSLSKGHGSFDLGVMLLQVSLRSLRIVDTPMIVFPRRHYASVYDKTTLRRAIGRGNISQARSVYENLFRHRQKVDRSVVRKLLLLVRQGKRQNDLEFVDRIINDMKGPLNIAPQHFEYHALIFAYGMQRTPGKSYSVLDRMRSDGIEPNTYTYNTLLGCYKRMNDVRSAEKLWMEMKQKNIEPDTVTYNTMLHLLSQAKEFDRLFELFDLMMESKESLSPDMYTFSTVLDAAVKSGNKRVGYEICEQLVDSKENAKLDTNTMNNILRFKADIELNQALDLYYSLPGKYAHIRPDRSTFNILMNACLKNGNPAKAYMIFKDMKKEAITPDVITYGMLIDAEAKAGDLESALTLFHDMCQESIEPNNRIFTSLTNIASSKKASQRDLDHLVKIVRKYQDTLELDTKAYNALMHGLALRGESQQVQHIYDTVFRNIDCQPDIATFTHLILAYVNDELIDDALEIYYTLREHHKKCRDEKVTKKIPIQLDAIFYSTLISSLATDPTNQPKYTTDDEYDSSPRLIAAMNMFNDMRPLQIQPTIHTYTSMLHACGQYRDKYVLDQVYQRIKVDLYIDPDIGMYNSLMDAYNRTEDGETVLDIWQTISMPASTFGITPDQTSVSIVFDSCGHNGLVSRAKSIWQWLKKTKFSLNTNNYNSYIECLCRETGRNGWDKAHLLVKEEMASPKKLVHGKPTLDEKTVNTLISFARKKQFEKSELESLNQWKSTMFQ